MAFNIVKISELSAVPIGYDLLHTDAMHTTIGTNGNSLSSIKVTLGDLSSFFNTNSPWISSGVGLQARVSLNAVTPGSVHIGHAGDTGHARLTVRDGLSTVGGLSATGGWHYFDDKVGIGTPTPAGPLDVDKCGGVAGNRFTVENDTNVGLSLRSGGSEGSPFIDFANDSSTDYDARLQLTGNDSLVVIGANFGIGETAPTAKVHVSDPALNATALTTSTRLDMGLKLSFSSPTNTSGHIFGGISMGGPGEEYAGMYAVDGGSGASTHLALFTGDVSTVTEAIRIKGNGYVGIGTTSPSYLLHVDGTAYATSLQAGAISMGDGTAASPNLQFTSDTDTGLYRAGANAIGITTGGNFRMLIGDNGYVGIGTDSPSSKLSVYETSSDTECRVLIRTSANTGGDPYIKFDGGGTNFIVGEKWIGTTSNYLVLGPGENPDTTSGIFVKGGGNVGIGTTTPSYKLDVNGTARTNGNHYIHAEGSLLINTSAPTIHLQDSSHRSSMLHCNEDKFYILRGDGDNSTNWSSSPYPAFCDLDTMDWVFGLGVLAYGDITAFYSDVRLKENVTNITDALSKVDRLNGVTYNPNQLAIDVGATDNTEERVGLLAHEVEEVLPHAVTQAPFDLPDPLEPKNNVTATSKTGDHYKTVQYDKLVPLLVEAVKELSDKVKRLEDNNG